MAVTTECSHLAVSTPDKFDPRLIKILKRCISLVWRAAAELVKRVLEIPPLLSLPPSSGVTSRSSSHISHAATVDCEVLRDPEARECDVIFVHGLYGSLANTWRQGDWRGKNKTNINKILLRRQSLKDSPCSCHEKLSLANLESDKLNFNDNDTNTNDNDANYNNDNIEKYLLGSVEIVDSYKDVIGDIFTNEFDMFNVSDDAKRNCDDFCDRNIDIDNNLNNKKDFNNIGNEINDNENLDVKQELNDEINEKCGDNIKEISDSKLTLKNEKLCECVQENDPSIVTRGKTCEVGCGCICPKCYSECWPRDWLAVDYPNSRVISINYTSDPHLWRPVWLKEHKRLRLHERADQMAEQLLQLGVGCRPIVWVGHSKGGLFIKQIYVDGYEEHSRHPDSGKARLWRQSSGFMFYSVPHRGSPLADVNIPPLLARSIELLEMGKDCAEVLSLQRVWLDAVRDARPAVRSLVETRRTLMAVIWLTIVSFQSADAGIGGLSGVEVDHREICKPSSRTCPLYQELLEVMKEALGR